MLECAIDHCLYFLAIVFSVLLRFTNSDYPLGIFKLFLLSNITIIYYLYNKLTVIGS